MTIPLFKCSNATHTIAFISNLLSKKEIRLIALVPEQSPAYTMQEIATVFFTCVIFNYPCNQVLAGKISGGRHQFIFKIEIDEQ